MMLFGLVVGSDFCQVRIDVLHGPMLQMWIIFPEHAEADQFENSCLAKINSEGYPFEPRNFRQVLSLLYFLTIY